MRQPACHVRRWSDVIHWLVVYGKVAPWCKREGRNVQPPRGVRSGAPATRIGAATRSGAARRSSRACSRSCRGSTCRRAGSRAFPYQLNLSVIFRGVQMGSRVDYGTRTGCQGT
jgi:hypothetical protein